MSLIHRWPLNGNTKDLGTKNLDFKTSTDFVFNANGMAGQCARSTQTGLYIPELANKTVFSCSIWWRVSSTEVVTNYNNILAVGITDGGTAGSLRYNNEKYSVSTTVAMHFHDNAAGHFLSSISINNAIPNPYDHWHNYTMVSDGSSMRFYSDGVQIGTGTVKNGSLLTGYISEASITGVYVNDIRIYDHALTIQEIRDISKGLVLHYAFDDPYVEGTTNLLYGRTIVKMECQEDTSAVQYRSPIDNIMVKPYKSVQLSSSAATQSRAEVYLPNTTAATTYSVSVYAKAGSTNIGALGSYTPPGNAFKLSIDLTTGAVIKTENIRNVFVERHREGWWRFGGTIDVVANTTNNIIKQYITTNGNSPEAATVWGSTVYYYGFQVEEKDHPTPYVVNSRSVGLISDNSGYGYNGTINGSLQISSDTANGHYSAKFNGVDAAVRTPNLATLTSEGVFTIISWFKHTDEWSSKGYETLYGGPSGFEIEAKYSSTNSPVFVAYSWGGSSSDNQRYTYTNNVWHQYAMVRTSSGTTWYMDGAQIFTGSAGSVPSGDYFIGAWKTATQQNFKGYIADFKLYATAFSAAGILTEYQRKAAITDNHHFVTGTLVENGNSSELLWTYVSPNGISYRQSGAADRISTDTDGSVVFTKQTWCKSPMIPVTPGEVLYYDLTYSNTVNNAFWVGFEYYNAAGGSSSNEGCYYIVGGDVSARNHYRLTGTITVPAQAGGAATSQLRLRVLNDWNNTGAATAVAKIHMISLRRINELKSPRVTSTSNLVANDLREFNFTHNTSLFQDGFVGTQEFEER